MRRMFSALRALDRAIEESKVGLAFALHVLIALHKIKLLDVTQTHAFPPVEREAILQR